MGRRKLRIDPASTVRLEIGGKTNGTRGAPTALIWPRRRLALKKPLVRHQRKSTKMCRNKKQALEIKHTHILTNSLRMAISSFANQPTFKAGLYLNDMSLSGLNEDNHLGPGLIVIDQRSLKHSGTFKPIQVFAVHFFSILMQKDTKGALETSLEVHKDQFDD